jgi:orotidine-5'-phosphate decarboxylase
MNFSEKSAAQWQAGKFLCVGIDVHAKLIPAGDAPLQDRLATFGRSVVEATRDVAHSYKINSAFFEAYGSEGIAALEQLCQYIRQTTPDCPIILDAKRGDIGSTNDGYVQFAFEVCGADAITVHPYMGAESLAPFLDRADKGVIVLCRTSNPGAGEFQDQMVGNQPLYVEVATRVEQMWNKQNNCWLVVGATVPEECAQIRAACPEIPFLIPGVGAQGGDLEATVKAARRADGAGFVIAVSRAILEAADMKVAAQDYHQQIQSILKQ